MWNKIMVKMEAFTYDESDHPGMFGYAFLAKSKYRADRCLTEFTGRLDTKSALG